MEQSEIRIWRIVPECKRGSSGANKYRKEWKACTVTNKKDCESWLIDKYREGISPFTLDDETIKTVCSLTVPERCSESAANAQIGLYLYDKFRDKNTPISEVIERMRQDKALRDGMAQSETVEPKTVQDEPISPVETLTYAHETAPTPSESNSIELREQETVDNRATANKPILKGVETVRFTLRLADGKGGRKDVFLEKPFADALTFMLPDEVARRDWLVNQARQHLDQNPASAIRCAIVENLVMECATLRETNLSDATA